MKKKYLFLSGLLSALLLVGVSPVQAAPEVYQTKQEAEAALKAHAKEIHENTLRYGVSVTEGSKLVEDNRLYKDGKMPPLTEKMDVLNALFSSMLKKENLDLKVRTLRVAKDEGKVTIGNPTLFSERSTCRIIRLLSLERIGALLYPWSSSFFIERMRKRL